MRGAADASGIEPSAISRRIQQMEGVLGVDPFERKGRRIAPADVASLPCDDRTPRLSH
ncbi:helix-turn-helix domain-containing protein [Bordetella genomosp. 10]|uniref:helix-turn-helix domain-containing protein n=1 Tax=Bordetella genomosp. 10 TaxID=1416804 RepID=UPI00359C942D